MSSSQRSHQQNYDFQMNIIALPSGLKMEEEEEVNFPASVFPTILNQRRRKWCIIDKKQWLVKQVCFLNEQGEKILRYVSSLQSTPSIEYPYFLCWKQKSKVSSWSWIVICCTFWGIVEIHFWTFCEKGCQYTRKVKKMLRSKTDVEIKTLSTIASKTGINN